MSERSSCLLKLDRAEKHLTSLQMEFAEFHEREPYRLIHELEKNNTEYVIRAEVFIAPPASWSILVGDFLYSVRSALDHFAYELAGPSPPVGSEFPIFRDRPKFERLENGKPARGSGAYKIRGVGPLAQAAVKSLQPYHLKTRHVRHPLWVLQEFANIDKHRRLHVASSSVAHTIAGSPSATSLPEVLNTAYGPLEHGAEVARFRLPDPSIAMQVHCDVVTYEVLEDQWDFIGPVFIPPRQFLEELWRLRAAAEWAIYGSTLAAL